ncbi:hypothetical protein AB0I81_24765 [Nonomuraea sp. NPDC050404]|uniref:hypothetical protein n=1 Tax=Nonomuraea sp. NPDC050404 TaxID=3155783 RepID=UPI003404E0B2
MPALTRIIAALRSDTVSGLLLIGAALVALIWANCAIPAARCCPSSPRSAG